MGTCGFLRGKGLKGSPRYCFFLVFISLALYLKSQTVFFEKISPAFWL